MEGIPTMQQEMGNEQDVPAAAPEQAGGPSQQGENIMEGSPHACAEQEAGCSESCVHASLSSGQTGAADAVGAAPGQAFFESRTDPGDAWSGGGGAVAKGGETGGFHASPEMMGGVYPGADPQHMGPIPGPDPHYGHHMHNPGLHRAPAYGAHMGGPQPFPHPHTSPGYHQGCHLHQGAMYGYPPQNPYFGAGRNPGFVFPVSPHHQYQGTPHHGGFAETVGKALQGQATPQDLISGLLNLDFKDDRFWKGVVIGSVAALLFNSDTVRQALAGALGGVFGKSQEKAQSGDQSGDEGASYPEKTK